MKKSLIIHFGAQKCGSSSIQNSLSRIARAGAPPFLYRLLDPEVVAGLSSGKDHERAFSLQGIDKILRDWRSEVFILSHEMMGNLPASVNLIADRAITHFSVDQVTAIGYTRIQSSYYLAEYRQWYFRFAPRLQADIAFLESQGLRADHFTPVERRMMVEALNSFTARGPSRNWFEFYNELMLQAGSSSTPYVVKSNHIPTADRKYTLLADFFAKAGIECSPGLIKSLDRRSNISFSPVMCEAMAMAICNQAVDSTWVPSPHQRNAWLEAMSAKVRGESFVSSSLAFSRQLMSDAAGAVDANSLTSNYQYCDLMAADRCYFAPVHGAHNEPLTAFTRSDLFNLFKRIEDRRSPKDIKIYEESLMPVIDMLRSSQSVS